MKAVARERLLLAVWTLGLFAACLALYTRHNDFPVFYHPDEPGKVEQIISGRWNFHHPMLLLTTTRAFLSIRGTPLNEQQVVEAGRLVSAVFTAIAAAALSLLAWRWRGWAAAIPTGVALLLHHQLFELAHYMKEDTALLMGVALTFLAAHLAWHRPAGWTAFLLGGAVALAVSGKYAGILMLPVAALVLWRARGERRGQRWALFAAGFLILILLINWPLLTGFAKAQGSLARETALVLRGQDEELRRSVPHAAYWEYFLRNTTPVIWALLAVFYWSLRRRWSELSLPERALVLLPILYAVLLSFSPKENDRYFLPATALFTVAAAAGLVELASWPRLRAHRRLVLTIGTLALAAAQLPSWTSDRAGLLRYHAAFQHDDLQELIDWMRTDVPSNATVLKDGKVNLPDPKRKKHASRVGVVPQTIVSERYAADHGTIDQLRESGISHVIISRGVYGKFVDERGDPETWSKQYRARREFYQRLQRDGKLVFERKRGTVLYLHPGLEVYELPK